MEVEMEMDDEEGEPPAPGTEEDGSGRAPLPATTKVVESSGSLGRGLKRKAGQPTKAVTIGSSPILYTQPAAAAAPVISASTYWGMSAVAVPSLPPETPAPPLPPLPSQPPPPSSQPTSDPPGVKAPPADKTKKLKKDKSKKSKIKMPSLVKKWQSIQRELDEEEKSSSSDEDREQLNKRSIEEWKQQQLLTGKAGKNANFEMLPVDWRERLKKRKMMMNST